MTDRQDNEAPVTGWFSRLPAAAVGDRNLSLQTLHVLAAITMYAKPNARAYPGVSLLASIVGLSERQVQRHLRLLEKTGYIVTERTTSNAKGGWGHNCYRIQYPAFVEPSGLDRTKGKAREAATEVTPSVSPREEDQGDGLHVTSLPKVQVVEVTSASGRGDISTKGKVTLTASDDQRTEKQLQAYQPKTGTTRAYARAAGDAAAPAVHVDPAMSKAAQHEREVNARKLVDGQTRLSRSLACETAATTSAVIAKVRSLDQAEQERLALAISGGLDMAATLIWLGLAAPDAETGPGRAGTAP